MNEMNKPAVALDHVSKSFGNRHVLCDLSLSATPGQALCILGRSGTGKSVTLKLMIALLRPDTGQIRIAGDNGTRRRATIPCSPQDGFSISKCCLIRFLDAA
jgi:phospholipid/cholesterol/gamma-HCH transport system ATP-binding protein